MSTKEAQKNVRKRFSWKKFFVVLGVGVVLFGAVYAIRYHNFQVRDIVVVGASVLDVEDIEAHVKDRLVGKHLWIFPKSSIFLINEQWFEHSLQEAFPRIETIVVKRDSFHGLKIVIKEFEALYLWCSHSDEDCYFMDKQGVVYSKAPVFSGTAYPKIIVDAEVQQLPFQGMVLSEVERISELESRLSEINITPTAFSYSSPREIRIDFLHNKTIATIQIDRATPTQTSL